MRATIGACDACKRRKVKCDATSPCANCRISQIPCEHRALPRKRGRPAKAHLRRSSPDEESASTQMDVAELLDASPDGPSDDYHSPRSSELRGMTSPHGPSTSAVVPLSIDSITTNLSPTSSHPSAATVRATPRNGFVLDAARIFQNLVLAVDEHAPESGETVVDCIHRCIDLFMQYLFPNTPIAHEPTLRSAASLFDKGSEFLSPGSGETPPIEMLRAFTLVTALCALVSSVMPKSLLKSNDLIWPFYHASRAMLGLYEEHDLESPNSSSFYIRTWQSAALQNTTGRDYASWHIHGEGTLLALRARLYDEDTVNLQPRLEAQLLRINFWLMYLADKTAAAFEVRPYVVCDDRLAVKLTLREHGDHENPLLDPSRPFNQNFLERRLLIGFHLKRRLWAAAADVIHEVRIFTGRYQHPSVGPETSHSELAKLTEMYLNFVGLADDLPSWLQSPNGAADTAEAHVAEYQTKSF